jgi:DNA-binding CsgD family transcriptional regulator
MDDQPNSMAEATTSTLRGTHGQFTRTPDTVARDAEAARLRSKGLSYRAIATELDVDVATAHAAVKRALAEIITEPAEEALAFELARLDAELVRLDDLYRKVEEVLAREHVTVSQGKVVTMDGGETVPDDDWILKAVDRLVKIDESRRRNGESRRRLLGLDQPAKTQLSGGLTYEIVGVDPAQLT